MSKKNSNDTIGNRTCDLPDCSAVPQTTAPTAGRPFHFVAYFNVQMTERYNDAGIIQRINVGRTYRLQFWNVNIFKECFHRRNSISPSVSNSVSTSLIYRNIYKYFLLLWAR